MTFAAEDPCPRCGRENPPLSVALRYAIEAELEQWTFLPGAFPEVPKINGFWSSVPVLVAIPGRPWPVVGAFFTYEGGDEVYPEAIAIPSFQTDEGLPYNGVVAWRHMPMDPEKLRADLQR